jgi:hypothetical protein
MLGLVPRMLMRSFSSKPPSLALAELTVTPGSRERESATFLSGILPISSAVTTSMTEFALRFASSDFSFETRMPLTITSSSCCCCACDALGPKSAMATAVPINVDRVLFMCCRPP